MLYANRRAEGFKSRKLAIVPWNQARNYLCMYGCKWPNNWTRSLMFLRHGIGIEFEGSREQRIVLIRGGFIMLITWSQLERFPWLRFCYEISLLHRIVLGQKKLYDLNIRHGCSCGLRMLETAGFFDTAIKLTLRCHLSLWQYVFRKKSLYTSVIWFFLTSAPCDLRWG